MGRFGWLHPRTPLSLQRGQPPPGGQRPMGRAPARSQDTHCYSSVHVPRMGDTRQRCPGLVGTLAAPAMIWGPIWGCPASCPSPRALCGWQHRCASTPGTRQSRVLLQWAVDSFGKRRLLLLPRRGRQATGRIRKRRTSQMDCFPSLIHLARAASTPTTSLFLPMCSSARVTQASPGGCRGAVSPLLWVQGAAPSQSQQGGLPAPGCPLPRAGRRQAAGGAVTSVCLGQPSREKNDPGESQDGLRISSGSPGEARRCPRRQEAEGVGKATALPAACARMGQGFFSWGSFLPLHLQVVLIYPR